MAAYYLPNYTTDVNTALGIYCTHDNGATWSNVPGLDSTYVNSMETFGDTTYILTIIGIYKMTCSGTIINPNGIVVLNGDADALKLYPNPSSGLCHIAVNSSLGENSYMSITDLTGRTVKNIAITGNETTFPTNDMNAGIYICIIVSDGKAIGMKRLVVE